MFCRQGFNLVMFCRQGFNLVIKGNNNE